MMILKEHCAKCGGNIYLEHDLTIKGVQWIKKCLQCSREVSNDQTGKNNTNG